MLDGKRYFAVFPDEDPELRPRIRAVLDALGNLDKAFRQHFEAFQPDDLDVDSKISRSGRSYVAQSAEKAPRAEVKYRALH
jgi:hypothetical protein